MTASIPHSLERHDCVHTPPSLELPLNVIRSTGTGVLIALTVIFARETQLVSCVHGGGGGGVPCSHAHHLVLLKVRLAAQCQGARGRGQGATG